MMRSAKYQFI